MKETIRQIKENLFSWYYILIAVIIAVLCFTTPYYMINENTTLSIIETGMLEKRRILSEETISLGRAILSGALGGWTTLFVPIFASYIGVKRYCDEIRYGFKRYMVFKEGICKYGITRAVSSVITGGSVLLVGYCIFSILCCLLFPWKTLVLVNEEGSFMNALFFRFLGVLLMGALWSSIGLAITVWTKDKYFVLCLPFVIRYIWNLWYQKNSEIPFVVGPDNMMKIGTGEFGLDSMIIYSVVIVLCCILFVLELRERTDLGE